MINNGIPDRAVGDIQIGGKKIVVADHAQKTLDYFGLTEASFKGGYVYSIAELVCLYLAKDFDYLVWEQGDTVLTINNNFVEKAIRILNEDKNVSVVAPWSECNTWHDEQGLDHFFSDQCFVVKVSEYREQIYGLTEPILDEYPEHGGDSFERMVGRYLHNTNRFRKVLIDSWCDHPAY